MSKSANELTERYIDFIKAQSLFFVATAAKDGRVNLSPKGMDTLRILDKNRLVWLNLTGSGNETAAHLREQDRITLMFCALDGNALIVRIYGHAKAIHPRDPEWHELIGLFPSLPGSRQIIDVAVDFAQQSCGTGVPRFGQMEDRGPVELLPFFDKLGDEGVKRFWSKKNQTSIDGKPTLIFGE